jgi:predicted protein tyrosine phosphatase
MDTIRHLLKGSPERIAAPRLGPETLCVHCHRGLGTMRSAAQQAKAEARHVCAEKLQLLQPAAPPPFN